MRAKIIAVVAALLAQLAPGLIASGWAATLLVGTGQTFAVPSAAAAAAHDGDTILIAQGTYFDCAIWTADHLTIAGDLAGDTVLTDTACEGKAAFVIRGQDIAVRDLTFARIRVVDGNGAGIRAEGGDLTVERNRFVNNQIGILAADADGASLVVRNCSFASNGGGGTADILVGRRVLLQVTGSYFVDAKSGTAISSAAARTEIVASRFEAAAPDPFVIGTLNGGGLAMKATDIVLSGRVPLLGAVAVAADGAWPRGDTVMRQTHLLNQTGTQAVLLRDWSGGAPDLADNVLAPGDVEFSTDGVTLHRLKQAGHGAIALLRGVVGRLHRMAASLYHRIG